MNSHHYSMQAWFYEGHLEGANNGSATAQSFPYQARLVGYVAYHKPLSCNGPGITGRADWR
jgi:hypothetical protein